MGTNTRISQKLAAIIESVAGTYAAPNVQIPFVSGGALKQTFDPIEDNSIMGVAFRDLPQQGNRKCAGNLTTNFDVLSSAVLMEAGFGAVSVGVYTCPLASNPKTMSFVLDDEVKTNKFAGCVLNNFMIQSEAEGDVQISTDILSWVAEVRDDTGFPAMSVSPGTRLLHRHATGTGYFRVGDCTDALAAGDNLDLQKIAAGVNWNFAEKFYNAQGPLQLLSGEGGRPSASLSFTLPRHSSDAFLAWRDARTPLQAEIYYYASATASLKIQIPYFVCTDATPSDDDIPTVEIQTYVGRNGMGTSYSNANMAFVSPIAATLDNA